jgi:hypothetical protein
MDGCPNCGRELPKSASYCAFCGEPLSGEERFAYLANIREFGDNELRTVGSELNREEKAVSKRRRVLHRQIFIVQAEKLRRRREA